MSTVTARVVQLSRKQNTPNGNPRWTIRTDTEGTLFHRDDAAVSYDISWTWERRLVLFTLDRDRRVTAAVVIPEEQTGGRDATA